jgi:dienelactone hydrolase
MTTQPLPYRHGDTDLEGFVAFDEMVDGPRPAVLVVHEWKGLNDYARRRAEMLVGLGYVGVAIDMYGKGVLAADAEEASRLMTPFIGDRKLCRTRATAGLDAARALPQVDPAKVAAIGYCFGGLTVLELARSGAGLRAAVSFHGNLSSPRPADAKKIKAKVLVCHGADDPHVPPAQVNSFVRSMRRAKVDWQLVMYGNTLHSFTFPQANDPANGLQYNPTADSRSWELMTSFLSEAMS